jgi:drug/metabolite transporter (DMT)-like permease
MSRATALTLLVAVTVLWGSTFTLVKVALADAGPLTFLALRFVLAAVLVAPGLHRREGSFPRPARISPWALACGVALFAGFALQTTGLATTTPARSAFITALSAILVPICEPALGLEPFSGRAWSGALLACAGLAVLLRPGGAGVTSGDLLTFGCAIAFAVHLLLLHGAVRFADTAQVNAIQVAVVAALSLGGGSVEGWRMHASARLGLALFITAVFATAAAFRIMTEVQRVLTAAETGVVLAFEPVAAALVSVLGGKDHVTIGLVAGGALVVAGVLVATSRRAVLG